ncbi:hypothetical protein MUP38_05350 [Candidatus Bathyarchaeota archaeon]|nr:hypothetical protein [Candidatus Bathyarchaeota archaeon]
MLYDLAGNRRETIQIWASAFSVTDDPAKYKDSETTDPCFDDILARNLNAYLNNGTDLPPAGESTYFNYRTDIQANDISYIICRDPEMIPKFANDPAFNLVFINDKVAVFMVKRNFN